MQQYRIDRIYMITYRGKKPKTLNSLYNRYLAKSLIVNSNAQNKQFKNVNFRGSIFKKVKFCNCEMRGCDFWGSSFNKCDFRGAVLSDCVFMSCRFKNCNFEGSIIKYTTIVNTSLDGCKHMLIDNTVNIYKQYPNVDLSIDLKEALKKLKNDRYLRKNKLLYIADNKLNLLNIFLLRKKYSDEQLTLLFSKLPNYSTKKITTFKKLEGTLYKIMKNDII